MYFDQIPLNSLESHSSIPPNSMPYFSSFFFKPSYSSLCCPCNDGYSGHGVIHWYGRHARNHTPLKEEASTVNSSIAVRGACDTFTLPAGILAGLCSLVQATRAVVSSHLCMSSGASSSCSVYGIEFCDLKGKHVPVSSYLSLSVDIHSHTHMEHTWMKICGCHFFLLKTLIFFLTFICI